MVQLTTVQAVRGRGRYKNHIVKRNKPITAEEMRHYTTKTASKVIKNNLTELEEYDNDDELESALEQMILDEMMKTRKPNITATPQRKRQNNKRDDNNYYITKPATQYDEDEGEEEDEEETVDDIFFR